MNREQAARLREMGERVAAAQQVAPTFNETPATIRAWIDETFPNSSQSARVRRSVTEWLELDAAIERGAPAEEIAEEAADVAITACGWATEYDVHQRFANCFVTGDKPLAMIDRRYFQGSIGYLNDLVGGHAALQSAINAKMVKNRKREWNIGADGTGQHVDKTSKSYLAGWSDAVVELGDERAALARAVERVREHLESQRIISAAGAKTETGRLRDQMAVVNMTVRDALAILDGKEG